MKPCSYLLTSPTSIINLNSSTEGGLCTKSDRHSFSDMKATLLSCYVHVHSLSLHHLVSLETLCEWVLVDNGPNLLDNFTFGAFFVIQCARATILHLHFISLIANVQTHNINSLTSFSFCFIFFKIDRRPIAKPRAKLTSAPSFRAWQYWNYTNVTLPEWTRIITRLRYFREGTPPFQKKIPKKCCEIIAADRRETKLGQFDLRVCVQRLITSLSYAWRYSEVVLQAGPCRLIDSFMTAFWEGGRTSFKGMWMPPSSLKKNSGCQG